MLESSRRKPANLGGLDRAASALFARQILVIEDASDVLGVLAICSGSRPPIVAQRGTGRLTPLSSPSSVAPCSFERRESAIGSRSNSSPARWTKVHFPAPTTQPRLKLRAVRQGERSPWSVSGERTRVLTGDESGWRSRTGPPVGSIGYTGSYREPSADIVEVSVVSVLEARGPD
jgi:hypothetical protein